MTSEQYDIVCEKIRQSKIGDKNPMYGKNSEDYMTEEAIQQKHEKIKQHQLNTRRMQNIAISPKVISVKLDQVNDYLKMGYTFFKCHFVLKKQIPSKYAKYHNMYFIEISRYLEDYFKLYGGQPITNDMVYTISRRHKSEFILNDDKIHYQRYIKSNNQITCELLTLAFKDKTIIKNAILNKNKMFDIDHILIYDSRYKNNNNISNINASITFIQTLNKMYVNGCNEILDNWKKTLNKSINIFNNEIKKTSLSLEIILLIKNYLNLALSIRSNMKYIRIRKFQLRYHSYASSKLIEKMNNLDKQAKEQLI